MSTCRRRHRFGVRIVPILLLLTCAGVGPVAAQGTFSRTGDMTIKREFATATLLTNGRVLVAGGGGSGFVGSQSAEIYDPNTGTFTATGSMNWPRQAGHTAVRLNDGRPRAGTPRPDWAAPTGRNCCKP